MNALQQDGAKSSRVVYSIPAAMLYLFTQKESHWLVTREYGTIGRTMFWRLPFIYTVRVRISFNILVPFVGARCLLKGDRWRRWLKSVGYMCRSVQLFLNIFILQNL